MCAVWRDGRLDGDAALVGWIEGLVKGAARVSIPGVVVGEATLDPADELLVRATLLSACDPQPCPRLGGDPARLVQAPQGQDVDY